MKPLFGILTTIYFIPIYRNTMQCTICVRIEGAIKSHLYFPIANST